jgi:hypothetical protein
VKRQTTVTRRRFLGGVQSSFRTAFVGPKNVNSTIPRILVKIASRRRIGSHLVPWRTCHGWHFRAYSAKVGADSP